MRRVSVHPEIGKFGRDQGVGKNLTAGIWLIFRGLNFSRNADIGQIGHLWMGTSKPVYLIGMLFSINFG
jgi:hypothetical protein